MCKTAFPLRLGHSRFQTLDGIPLSALVPLPCPSTHFYPFIPAHYLTYLPPLPPTPSPPSHSNPPPPGYYVWPLSTLIPRIYSIYLFPLPLPTPPLRLSHPPPIEPAISCMATSTRKRARWHSTGSGPTSTCSHSYCPSARQQQSDDIKSCDQTRIQSGEESL